MAKKISSSDFQNLRSEAEKILKLHPGKLNKLKGQGLDTLLHEISVHQIELEMQNEELRNSQQLLEQERTQYFEMYHFAPIGYVTFDRHGVITEANLAAQKLLGFGRDFLIGNPFSAYLEPGSSTSFILHVQKVFKSDEKETCEIRLKSKSGQISTLRLESVSFITDRTKLMRSILTDLTEVRETQKVQQQKKQELETRVTEGTEDLERVSAALRASEERFRSLVTASSDVLYWMSPDWSEMRQLNGGHFLADTEKPNLKWLQEYIPSEDQPHVMKTINEAIRTKSVFELEHRVVRSDGAIGWTYSRAVPVLDENGDIIEWFGAASDITERKQAEERLRVAQSELKTVTDTMAVGVAHCSRDLRCLWVNRSLAKWLGQEPETLIGRPFVDIIGIPAYERIRPYIEQVLEGERVEYEAEVTYLGPGPRWINAVYEPTRDAKGEVDGWVTVITDITKRKEMQQEMVHLASFPQLNPNPVIEVDLDGNICYLNPTMKKLLPDPRMLVVSNPWIPQFDSLVERFKKNPELIRREIRVGDSWYQQSVHYVAEMERIRFYWSDITERKRMEEELRRSKDNLEMRVQERTKEVTASAEALEEERQRFRHVLDELPVYVVLLTPDHEVSFANKVFIDRFGDAHGIKCFEHLFKRTKPCEDCQTYKVLDTMQPHEWEWNGPDGRIYSVYDFPFNDTDGSALILEMGIDITDQKKAEDDREKLEEHLRQVHKMEALGTLAGGIAHDFNNMLAVILGNAELVLGDINEMADRGSGTRGSIEQIIKASKRSRDLVREILTFSRKDVTRGRKPLRLVPLLNETVNLLRGSIPSTIAIDLNVTAQSRTILGDSSQIQQVLMNLASNAIHAMGDDGGTLTIALSNVSFKEGELTPEGNLQLGEYVKLTVSDTGTGMSDEIKARIFEPFFTTKGLAEGTGMGLAVAFGIVKSHEGAITVESKEGQGSTFNLFFPAYSDSQAEETRYVRGSLPTGTERILLVDDESLVLNIVAKTLRSLGYKVITAKLGTEAFERFKEKPGDFDLIITDHVMPEITGIRLAEKVLKVRKDVPVILFTGYSDAITPQKAKQAGISSFVMKPVVKSELAGVVRRVLDEKKASNN